MMRDLLDKIRLLSESTGLANRKPGDKFKNSAGDVLVFQSLDFYPEQGGTLEEPELDDLIKKLGTDVKWQSNKKPKTGGAAIATFDSEAGPVQYGFFLKQVYPSKTQNKIKNEFDGYRYDSKVAAKERSGLAPTDLLTQMENLSAADIISQLDNNAALAPELKELAKAVVAGGPYPITVKMPEGVSFTGIRDYFCEILQPLALQTGKFKGNAGEAVQIFMGGSFENTTITFPTAKNNGLADSLITKADGRYVKVSSKGGSGGAWASVKNLADAFAELETNPESAKIVKKYADVISLIRELQRAGQNYAPLYLGQKYDIISKEEADIVRSLRNKAPVNLNNLNKIHVLTPNLKKLSTIRKPKNPESVDLFFHLLANIAQRGAEEVNKTNFGEAASTILNNGALIQVYSGRSIKEQGDKLVLSEFVTKFPGESIRGVTFESGKTYYSTGINGNFTFNINRGQGAPDVTATEPPAAEHPKAEPDLSQAAKNITRESVGRAIRKPQIILGVGREKRS